MIFSERKEKKMLEDNFFRSYRSSFMDDKKFVNEVSPMNGQLTWD